LDRYLRLLLVSAATHPDGLLIHRGTGTLGSSEPFQILMKAGMIMPLGSPVEEPADINQNRYIVQTYAITPKGKAAAKHAGAFTI